ncbi:MAG: amino acid adenylation domain-containing protein, partial [Thermoanaerobaculia bacterium]
ARAGDVNESDAFLQKTTIGFDVSLAEIFAPLVNGGRTVLARAGGQQDPEYLVRLIREQRITYASFPPSLLYVLFEQEGFDRCDSLRVVITGGETVPAVLPGQLYRHLPGASLFNRYGPTETTISVTSWLCERDVTPRTLPIGRPTAKARVYLLGPGLQPVPAGVTGEIFLGGTCVARGYLRRPDLTAEKFVPDPFGGEAGARLYRSGDLARYRSNSGPDGAIEFVGRVDQQVKIRGFRVELGEIEAALARHPAIQEVAVVDREDGPTRSLAAYLVFHPGETAGEAALRSFLAESLPAWMVPADFVALDALPLSATGKVDRKALPAPRRRGEAAGFEAPRTPTEELLAAIWADLLAVGRVGVNDSFFDLGGHSLLAAQVTSRVRESFAVELPLRLLFERPTVAALAQEVDAAARAGAGLEAPPIVPAPREGDLPLSFAQERLWFLDRFLPGTSTYNLPLAVRLHGPLSAAAFEAALREVVRRHEALRTTFAERGERPAQRIAPDLPLAVPRIDLEALPAAARQAEARRIALETALLPFDLEAGPLVRAVLVRLGAGEHLAAVSMHHIVSDGWSAGVLAREAAALYGAALEGRPSPLPELPVQYADFARWQRDWLRGETLATAISYWRQRLAGAPPLLELPADRPRPAVQRYLGRTLQRSLSEDLTRGLTALGRARGATPFMALLAGLQALLGRYTGRRDVPVGTPVAGRDRLETEGLIGFFVNTLVMRADLGGDPGFAELLQRVRETALGAYAHQDLPFEKLVEELAPERNLSHTPLFQVMLVLQNTPRVLPEHHGVSFSLLELDTEAAKFDLTLHAREAPRGLVLSWLYNRDLFDAATVARLSGHLETLLAAAVADPGRRLSELPLLTPAEEEQLLGAAVPCPAGPCLHEIFAARAVESPEAVAVTGEGSSLSYGELDAWANQIAWHLIGLGVSPGDLVGLCLERSLGMVVAILGTLKAGAAYVPLDPAYPAERLAFMLEDSRVPVLLTQESLAESLPETARKVFLDRIEGESEEAPAIPVSPDHPAYVIYTSGSTGRPKGVVVRHGNAARLFTATDPWFGFGPRDVWTLFHSYAFDFSVWEIWGALLYGGRLVVVPYWVSRSPEAFHELLVRERVTVLNQTPSAFRQLIWADRSAPELALRYVIFGGEALEPASLIPWFERHGDREPRLINMYGITETTVHVTWRPVGWEEAKGSGSVIGRPIPGLGLYVLDANGQPLPAGVPGEIHVGGAGLALGYLGRPELTAERFVPNPYGESGSRLYRSGDLARFLADGDLEYLGRIDHQVKIRGFRIELGEIESALAAQPAVREAVVLAREDGGEKRLVAYVVPDGPAPTLAGLRAALAGGLPEYMLPSALVVLGRMPLTGNGKVDRKALPAPQRQAADLEPERQRTPTQELLATIWADLLGIERAGLQESFFVLGGHSLLATRVISRVREAFGVELPLQTLFERPTVAALAAEVDAAVRAGVGPAAPPIVPAPREGALPLSFAQERLWFLDQLQPGSPAYNMPTAVRLRGKLDLGVFRRSLRAVAVRHETLRTTFAVREGRPVQGVAADPRLDIPLLDLRALPQEPRERALRRLAGEEGRRPFNLAAGPLVRCTLVRLAGEEHAALLTLHHIVSDGWSMGVLIREIAELYRALSTGKAPELPELAVQYADFAIWQRGWLQGEVLEKELGYWRERLKDAPPLLELPTDRPRPPFQRFLGRHHRWALSRPLMDSLAALCRRGHATFFMGLLAVYQAILQRYTGRRDVIVGTPIAGRNRVETEPLIGFFLNNLVLRTGFDGDPGMAELLERVRRITLEAFAHQDLPFEKLVEELAPERNLSHSPLFQVMLVLQNAPMGALELPGLTVTPVETEGTTAKLDLTLNVRETEGGLLLLWLYNRDLFDEPTIVRLSGHLETLLAAAVADPARRLSELPLLTAEEELQLLDWNDTSAAYPLDGCLHELIEAQMERSPGEVAVSFEGESLTCRELGWAASRLARQLIGMGVGPEVPVGVFAERSLEMVVALLAILKAGGAYLPVDPDYPADRVAYMLEDSRVPVVLTQERLTGKLPETGARTVLLSPPAVPWEETSPVTGVRPGNLAYVIYTSGSTGRPKGTMNSHRGIVNRLLWMQQEYGLTPEDRVLQKTPFSFDVSVWEFFWPLLTGARLVMARPGGHQDPNYLVRTINAEGITTMHFVPSMLQAFLEAPGVESCASLIRVMASGEALPYELQRRFHARLGAGLHNLYGPTEAAVDVTWWTCEREGRRALVPIGRPVANTQIHLLDASFHPVPVGVPGELYIGGIQVGRGYLGRPELTAERFIPDPFSAAPGARLYRTGDLARYLPDGAVDFLGRIDHQVKLRGLRIELGEIEAAIAAHAAVREAVVLVRAEGGALGAVNLVAYVTGNPDPVELRTLLGRSLPEYMVPAAWVVLDELPLSPNGKVDRKALSQIAPERKTGEPAERVAPRTDLERALAGLWSESLGLAAEELGIHDSFFALGGNSITGAILINRLQERLGEIVHVVAIFDAPTVAALAAHLAREYPQAVARIWGADSLGEAGAAGEVLAPPLDEERLADVQGLIRTLSPAVLAPEKNPPAVFVLSPPRSGSTLLRVMLGGNPRLFAPPELELLNFNTLTERREAFPGRDAFRLEGLLRAVMEIQGDGPEAARELIERFEGEGMTTQELYRRLQEWIQPRLLVDKTPTYAWDPATLQRAEEAFEDARYIHLVRHPYGMIRSFEEARIDQIFFSLDHPFSRRELAEALWVIAHRNIASFLEGVPEDRQTLVRFEELLRDPEGVLLRVCAFLGIDYHPDMAEPYKKKSERMTDGLHAESRMLGDVKFHQYRGVEAGVAESWRGQYTRDFLGEPTWELAASLGYDVERERLEPR